MAAEASRQGHAVTAQILFESIGSRADFDDSLIDGMLALDPPPEGAITGLLRGIAKRRDEDWIIATLNRLIDRGAGALAIRSIHALKPTTGSCSA